MSFSCHFCNKEYRRETNYDKHVSYCSWTHSKKDERPLLTEGQRDQLMYDLFMKMQQLQKKVDAQQRVIGRFQKKDVLPWLNDTMKPTETFSDWFRRIPITQLHLENIFTNDLLQSILLCVQDGISQYPSVMPIFVLTKEPKVIYIYKDEWVVLTKEANEAVQIMSRRFEILYGEWQKQNKALINSCEEWKVKDMNFCRTVMDAQGKESARNIRLRAMLYTLLHQEVKN